MHDTTLNPSVFPDDELRRALRQLFRFGRVLEPQPGRGTRASLSEVMALGELAEVEEMSQHELAAQLGLEKSTVSRLVAGLVERGWVTRSRNSDNRRLYRLALTEDGRAIAGGVGKELKARHEQLLGELTPDERQALAVGLAGLVRVLKGHSLASHGHGFYASPPRDSGQATPDQSQPRRRNSNTRMTPTMSITTSTAG